MYDGLLMSTNLAKIVAAVGGELESPTIIDDIDRVLIHLLRMRAIAADLHGDSRPAPVTELASSSEPVSRASVPNIPNDRGYDGTLRSLIACYKSDPDST